MIVGLIQACRVSRLDFRLVTWTKNVLIIGICKSGWNVFSLCVDVYFFFRQNVWALGLIYSTDSYKCNYFFPAVIWVLNFASKHWFFWKTSCFKGFLVTSNCRENNLLLNVAGNWFTYVDLPSACNWFSRRKHRLKICS